MPLEPTKRPHTFLDGFRCGQHQSIIVLSLPTSGAFCNLRTFSTESLEGCFDLAFSLLRTQCISTAIAHWLISQYHIINNDHLRISKVLYQQIVAISLSKCRLRENT